MVQSIPKWQRAAAGNAVVLAAESRTFQEMNPLIYEQGIQLKCSTSDVAENGRVTNKKEVSAVGMEQVARYVNEFFHYSKGLGLMDYKTSSSSTRSGQGFTTRGTVNGSNRTHEFACSFSFYFNAEGRLAHVTLSQIRTSR